MFNSLLIAIASNDVIDWLKTNPRVLRLLDLILWGTNHPIWGLIILLIILALLWNLFKGFSYLVGILVRELMQAPMKLLRFSWRVSSKSIQQVGNLAIKQLTGKKNTELPALPPASSQPVQIDKQQRLTEISTRLEEIQKEQNELLQEVASLLGGEKVTVEVTQDLRQV
ncbi:hypothetical protein IQ264_03155 [Phormidium sp. LEGE 05292]|uniref:hypothetical protein n=1 Tax=[Phormidium] sp. LEGE 05292 TaxID=767427 RepID=UPI00187E30CE|nr:hypothetical protein [Phormidium sp. LEGE 05292]MBE9224473.1 hypothetical protein [Phormidium sp. LEGE 05292]